MADNFIINEVDLKTIQNIELSALRELFRVSTILDIYPFLIDGSALGAMRHNGFIPWDDDIDVGMLRDDYDRFIQEAQLYLSPNFYLQSPERNLLSKGRERCPYPYAKLRVNDTKFIEYCHRNIEMHHGIYIDIFPFDEVPDGDLNLKELNRINKLKKLYVFRECPDISRPPKSFVERTKQILRHCVYFICRLIPRRVILHSIYTASTKYSGTDATAFVCFDCPGQNYEHILKTELLPLSKQMFEDLEVHVPGDTDAYLTKTYGNWRELPPENKRYGHKPWSVTVKI